MKKVLFILFALISITTQAQVANGTETKQNAFRSLNPQTATTVNYLTTMGTDGTMGRVTPVNVTIPTIPLNYTVLTPTLGAHLSGIDTRLGQISSTTAGLTQRIYFTADDTTVNSVVYFASNSTGKGATAAGSPPALVLADNTKGYFTKDLISIPQPAATIGYAGSYSGNLTVSATPTPVATRQRFTVEVYRTNNLGTPIASGVSGAPVGDLGVTVVAILDSGELNINAGAITNVAVNGILTQNITINTGERLRYHVSAAKIGAGGGNVTFQVYYGSSYNSYYDVPVAIRTNAVLNDSGVTGVTATDALNTLNTGKANDTDVVHKTGDTFAQSINFDPLLSQDASDSTVKKRDLQPETIRLQSSDTDIFGWGDSLTLGAGGSGTTYLTAITGLTNFTTTNKGVSSETSTQIKDRLVADTGNYGKTVIIWAGRNNYTAPTTVKSDIATMISTIGHTRYLVVGILNSDIVGERSGQAGWTQINQLNADLKAIYGKKFIDIRPYLVSLNDGTTQGNIDFANDVTPYYLRSDNLHLNTAGYTKVGEYINRRLGILFNNENYFQSKDFLYYSGIYNTASTNTIPKSVSNGILGNSTITDSGTGSSGIVNINNLIGGSVSRVLPAGSFNTGKTINLTNTNASSYVSNIDLTKYNEDGIVSTFVLPTYIKRTEINKTTNQTQPYVNTNFDVTQSSSATLPLLSNLHLTASGAGTGTVTEMSMIKGNTATFSNSFPITNFYGVQFPFNPQNNVTNARGILIGDLFGSTISRGLDLLVTSGTGKYNIYAQGSAPNFFSGNVGIGPLSTNPVAPLEVQTNIGLDGLTSHFTKGVSDNNFRLGFHNGTGSTQNSEQGALSFDFSGSSIARVGFNRGTGANTQAITFITNGAEKARVSASGDALQITGNASGTIDATTSSQYVRKGQLDLKSDIVSPIFTGDPQAPTPTLTDNDTSIATTAFVQTATSAVRPYLVYTALISQSGTSAPTEIVLENTLGATATWSRSAAGTYQASFSSAVLTANKTAVFVTKQITGFTDVVVSANSNNTASIDVVVSNGTLRDSELNKASLEIRVYN